MGDSLALAREALQALPDDRRTHLVTSQELVGALDDLAAALLRLPDGLDDLVAGAGKAADLARVLADERADAASEDVLFWVEAVQRSIASHRRDVAQDAEASAALDRRLQTIEVTTRAMVTAMEFDFLLDRDRRLLAIGHLVAEDTLDPIATICWHRKRGSPVSWRSPWARCRPATGSGWAAK